MDSHDFNNTRNDNELSVIVERLKSSDEKNLDDPDCTINEVEVSSGDFLLKYPRGAYTSARTVKRKSVMDLQSHIDRMVHSLRLMKFISEEVVPTEKCQDDKENNSFEAEESSQVTRELISYRKSDTFKLMIIPLLRKGLSRYCEIKEQNNKGECEDEIKITILVCYSFKEKRPILVAHFINLHSLKISSCKVEVYGEPRKSAEAKDSQWVRDRKSLESSMQPGFNEIILSDSCTHNIYEGLSSNFFAVLYNPDKKEPLVVTAPLQYVLEGTILKIVKIVCERDKIDFQFWFPNANDAEQWKGAFITSTSRLVLPIELIKFRDGRPFAKLPSHNDTIDHIKNEVEKEIFHRAYRILR
ncbi:hypothetical protein RclHR1_04420011 [Rhizophagus clarus]|uniref:Thioredoxin-like protein n=1 Tax=Rhizophagus clarus TaxID=94130 RepID=A0A2Z6RIY4_9GLOM|nr:hypothetical protein RclHR1_04420011 [Rhizophagus clarus]GES81934.1 thioredoxin-like protein [Rhizophagus clarus]